LKGYAELYPDSNKVLSSIMGVKGLASRGWLIKMGQKLYSLSREGRQVVRRILEGGEPAISKGGPPKLSREQEKILFRLFDTDAVEKYTEGRKPDLTFSDACRFWDISESMNGDTLNSRMDKLRIQLADMERILSQGETELSNGRSVSTDDISMLIQRRSSVSDIWPVTLLPANGSSTRSWGSVRNRIKNSGTPGGNRAG